MTREQDIALTQLIARVHAFGVRMGMKAEKQYGTWDQSDHAEAERREKAIKNWVREQLRDAAAKGRHDERGEE